MRVAVRSTIFSATSARLNRAAVVIGVDRTGGQTPLESAAAGARDLASFLREEGFDVKCLTDDSTPVTADDVVEAIESFVTLPPRYHLLVVYFSGHGYWQARSDVWLLSGAPVKSREAVNLRTAEDGAKYSGIPNIVFISDACRSIPNSRSGALVEGTPIFPNYDEITRTTKIDFFKATTESLPAYEVSVGGKAQSVLTTALLSAFHAPEAKMVREVVDGANKLYVVPNRCLEEYLPRKVNEILESVDPNLSQNLDIDVPSSDDIYIGRARNFPPAPKADARPPMPPPPPRSPAPARAAESGPPGPVDASKSITIPVLPGDESVADVISRSLSASPVLAAGTAISSMSTVNAQTQLDAKARMPFSAIDHFETGMGIVVTGLPLARVETALQETIYGTPQVQLLSKGDGQSKPGVIRLGSQQALSVLLQTADGRCAIIAALPGFIAHAVFNDTGLANVSYVPSSNQWRWPLYLQKRAELDNLRAMVSVAVDQGIFKLHSSSEANTLADRIRIDKSIDPTLGLYAAHALYQAGNDDELASVLQYMRGDLATDLFDVRLLAQRQFTMPDTYLRVVPVSPMLSQTWSFLAARGVRLQKPLQMASRYLCGSLWTTFEPEAAAAIFDAIARGELHENSFDSRPIPRREEAR
jgi:hypothetical protein